MITTIATIITFIIMAFILGIHIHRIVIIRPVDLTKPLLGFIQLRLSRRLSQQPINQSLVGILTIQDLEHYCRELLLAAKIESKITAVAVELPVFRHRVGQRAACTFTALLRSAAKFSRALRVSGSNCGRRSS